MEPTNIDVLQFAARIVDLEANVRRSSANLPSTEHGVVILGTRDMLMSCKSIGRAKINSHGTLLERIPLVFAAWLILLFCASSRANFLLSALPPHVTHEFSFRHDTSLWRCLGIWDIASLPLSLGGLGLERTADQACGKLGQLERFPRIRTVTMRLRRFFFFFRNKNVRSSRMGTTSRLRPPLSFDDDPSIRNTGGSIWQHNR